MPTVEQIEREIAALTDRKGQLAALHAQAVADAVTAETNLEKFLDESDLVGGLNGAQLAVHVAKQNCIDISNAVARQNGLIVAAEERLAQARELEARERVAVEREAAASAVEQVAGELQAAIKTITEICDRMIDLIPRAALDIRTVPEFFYGWTSGQALNEHEVVRAILAEATYCHAPHLFEVVVRSTDLLIGLPVWTRRRGGVARGLQRDDTEFLNAVGAANAYIAEPLRASARSIRDGTLSHDAPATLVVPPPPPPQPMVNMLLLQPTVWKNHAGHIVRNAAWTLTDLPANVATRALQLGVGCKTGTPECEAYLRARQSQLGGVPLSAPPIVDLGGAE